MVSSSAVSSQEVCAIILLKKIIRDNWVEYRFGSDGRGYQARKTGGTRLFQRIRHITNYIGKYLQYYYETKQPQRKNFIARQLSFHGNTLGTLSLAFHKARRAPYETILDHENFHHVSPAYAKRFKKPEETEEQYVERLRQELEDKFLELGPDTVIGCKSIRRAPRTN